MPEWKLDLRRFATCCGLVMMLSLACETAIAQAAFEPKRTPDGHPDFQGVWQNLWMTPIERPPEAATVNLDATEAARVQAAIYDRLLRQGPLNPDGYSQEGNTLAIVQGQHRAAMVIDPPDGLLPYRPEARPKPFAGFPPVDGPEAMIDGSRCIAGMGRAPMLYAPGANLRTIVQTPADVMIHSEAMNDLRIIGIGARHRPAALRSLEGDSIGRWEGDTLVVETTNFRKDDPVRSSVGFTPLIVRADAKIVERFRLVSNEELLYQFTVEDPAVYARPWLAEYSMLRTHERQYEFACHEGNYSLTNILHGARAYDRKPASNKEEAKR